MKKAFITGCSGQDGSYLAEQLLAKDYEVFGMVRRTSTKNLWRLENILRRIEIVEGDLQDQSCLVRLMTTIKPDEVYNLAAQSFVGVSFEQPENTADITGLGALRMLEAVRIGHIKAKFYQASSSEMLFCASPYGVAKLFAHKMTKIYRDAYKMFAVSGTLFNHESPRRGLDFVTRKITHGIVSICSGLQDYLKLGDITTRRDFGYAPDYTKAMWMMLQQDDPKDQEIGTGESHSIREFLELAFSHFGLDWKDYVEVGGYPSRPIDVPDMKADLSKNTINWKPTVSFKELVEIMVKEEVERFEVTPNEQDTHSRM